MGWSCSACTYNNANLASQACEICGTARPRQDASAAKDNGSGWSCRQCTYVNVPLAIRCSICDAERIDDAMMIDDEKMVTSPSPVSRLNAIDLTDSPAAVSNNAINNVMKIPDKQEISSRLEEAQARERERIQHEQALKAKAKEQRKKDLAERREEVEREKRELAKKKDADRLESTKQLFEMEERHQLEIRHAREKRDQIDRSLNDIASAIRFIHQRYGMEVVKDVLSVISVVVLNIINAPNELKFRRIQTSSSSFKNRIESRLGGTALMKLLGFQYQFVEDDLGKKQEIFIMESPNLPFLQAEYDKMAALLARPETRLHTFLPTDSENEDVPLRFLLSFRKLLENIVVAPSSHVAGKVDVRSDIYKAFFAPFSSSEVILKEFQFDFQDPFWVWQGKEVNKLQKAIRDLDKEIVRRLPKCTIAKTLNYVNDHNQRSATAALIAKVEAVLSNLINDMHQTKNHMAPLQPLLKLTGPIDGLSEFLASLGFIVDPKLQFARISYPYEFGIEPYRFGLEIVQRTWSRILKSPN